MDENELRVQYVTNRKSMSEIATIQDCSVHKVQYWLMKYNIPRRNNSEATYAKRNGLVDPFKIVPIDNVERAALYGLGVGIYWGEGNKKNLNTVRVGNTDARLILVFVKFLVEICSIDSQRIRYGLQLFTDIDESRALDYWKKELNITRNQIMPTVNRIISGKIGTYKTKNQFGVMTVYVFNKKLRDWLVNQLFVPQKLVDNS